MKLMAAALALTLAHAIAGAADCKLMKLEEWTVRVGRDLPIVDGEINRHKIGILVDTSAERSYVLRSAAARLALTRQEVPGARMYGPDGSTPAETVRIDELRIGAAARSSWTVLVAAEQDFATEAALVLGNDFFRNVDLEFDLANDAMRLFQAKDCGDVALAYWAKSGVSVVTLESGAPPFFTASVNGTPLRTVLDSGSPVSVLAAAEAERLGVASTAKTAASGCAYRVGRKPLAYRAAPVESFALGNETIRNPTLHVGTPQRSGVYSASGSAPLDPFAGAERLVLGADFLRSHRVLLATSQRKLYFTYGGGPVFSPATAKGCS